MKIELNLVFSQSIFSKVFALLARSRADVTNDTEVLGAIKQFLQSNLQVISNATSNEDMVNRIRGIDEISINEFLSLKYLLAMSGISILVNEVAEYEVDAEEIPAGKKEYLLIDELSENGTFVKLASKVVMDQDEDNLYSVYSKVVSIYDFFNTPLTEGYNNPLKTQLKLLKQNEDLLGVSPVQITSNIEASLEFLGKSIILLTSQEV